jgi:hypothetical protein
LPRFINRLPKCGRTSADIARDIWTMLIRHQIKPQVIPMTRTLVDRVGFSHPIQRKRAFAELITTAALLVSLAIAVTAVSIGIARADTLGGETGISCVR